jgi:hypothetical protein
MRALHHAFLDLHQLITGLRRPSLLPLQQGHIAAKQQEI